MYVGLVGHQSRVHLTLNLHPAAAFACVSHYQKYGNTWNKKCGVLAFKYFANTVVSDRHTKITRNTWSQNYGDVYKAQWEYYWPSVDIKQLCKNCWHTVVILGILGIKSAATLPGRGSDQKYFTNTVSVVSDWVNVVNVVSDWVNGSSNTWNTWNQKRLRLAGPGK